MTEITKYVADDGVEFDDEWDCRQYEWEQGFNGEPLYQMLGAYYERLDPKDSGSYEDPWFLFFPSHESIRQCQEMWDCDIVDCYIPKFLDPNRHHYTEIDCGLWAYDEDTENWYHLGKRIEKLTAIANKCLETVNGGV